MIVRPHCLGIGMLLSACGARTGLGGETSADASVVTNAFVVNECGYVGEVGYAINAGASCQDVEMASVTGPQLGIWILFAHPPGSPGIYPVVDGYPTWAHVCSITTNGFSQCMDALAGTLTLDSLSNKEATGSYVLHLPTTTLAGTFVATICRNSAACSQGED